MGRSDSDRAKRPGDVDRGSAEPQQASMSLVKEEAWLRSVVQNTSDIVSISRPDGTIRYVTPSSERVLGYRPEEMVGESELDYVHPDDVGRMEDVLAQAREKPGSRPSVEVRWRHKDGSWRWLEVSYNNLLGDPKVRGMVSSASAITVRKMAEEALRESEERFRSAFEDVPIGVSFIGLDGRRLKVNLALCEMLGSSEEELLNKGYLEQVHPDEREASSEQFRRTLEKGVGSYTQERRYVHADGHVVWNLTSVSLVLDSQGKPDHFVCLHQDITERKEAEEALRESEERYRVLAQKSSDIVTLLGIDGTFRYQSPSIERILGYLPEEMIGENAFDHVHPEDVRRVRSAFLRGLNDPGYHPTVEYRARHKDGSWVWMESVGSNLIDDPKVGEFVVNSRDVTERRALQEQLKHQATHDLLTSLPNRQLFLDRLGQALRRTRRRPGYEVAVLFVDLDNFKVVNDSLGHEAGDTLLAKMGERLRSCLRPEDTLARFGGDEFVMLLENVRSPRDAVRVAERIAEELRSPLVLEGRELALRASIGIALGDDRSKGPGELLKDADTAMYRAKEEVAGYRIFEPSMYEQALRRLKLENDMRWALEAGEFVVHYQPIVDLRTGKAWGIEALVRWEHPERGLLGPSRFVPVAEETGLIVPLGERVLEEACRQAAQWQRERPEADPLIVCVNLSARQLRRQDLAETIRGVLRRTGLEGRCLCLDITETLYITVLEGNTGALDDLRRMGVRLSIDDFGMGYSSLSYLKRLPANTLKIDRSFVAGLGEDAEDSAIVQMTVNLAYTLGMRLIAEGVESEEQAEQLRQMGCDLGQGFHFAVPLSSEETSRFLSR
jgi:diguanylate cyclase (GGDEF)-like protein/PAS domain S-box-containing protein